MLQLLKLMKYTNRICFTIHCIYYLSTTHTTAVTSCSLLILILRMHTALFPGIPYDYIAIETANCTKTLTMPALCPVNKPVVCVVTEEGRT
uniref:Uncharacterized protein n=1 Tax=Glossina brevipalpis TaxID=37001 RepID=A0A1A9WKW1_9MUSC